MNYSQCRIPRVRSDHVRAAKNNIQPYIGRVPLSDGAATRDCCLVQPTHVVRTHTIEKPGWRYSGTFLWGNLTSWTQELAPFGTPRIPKSYLLNLAYPARGYEAWRETGRDPGYRTRRVAASFAGKVPAASCCQRTDGSASA